MRIDQVGLPAVLAGRARTDGLSNGAQVTVTNTTGGSTTTVRLLWVPPEDLTARATLLQSGPTTWTFSPQAGTNGSYRIEMIADLGLPTESRQIRIFGVRNAGGLLVPAANELANPNATLENNGSALIADSENNEPFGVFTAGSAWGWWKAVSDIITNAGTIPAWGGSGLRVLLKAEDGSYTTQQIGVGIIGNAPTPEDDSSEGFLVGSWWVQFIPGEFPLPGTQVLWDCHSNNEGAAIWQQRPLASEIAPIPVGRAAAIGTSPNFARVDHVHDGGSEVVRTTTVDTTISNTDAVLFVATSSADIEITLPPASPGRAFFIKKTVQDANYIILLPVGGAAVDTDTSGAVELPGSSDPSIFGSWYIVCDGVNWWLN